MNKINFILSSNRLKLVANWLASRLSLTFARHKDRHINKTNFILSSLWMVLLVLFVILVKHLLKQQDLSGNVILAVIGSATTIMTVLGTVLVTQMTNANASKRERDAEVRKIKQENYNRLIEAMSLHIAYQNGDLSDGGALDAKTKFCRETNRLPLYASQAVVEWVNLIASGKSQNANFNEFYSLLRSDLCTSSYQEFKSLPTIHFQLPGKS